MIKPVTLCILDGWGDAAPADNNAIHLANTPNWDAITAKYGYSKIATDGEAVGLPAGQMGNSEVGHATIGAGRILLQDLPRIDKAVSSGELAENEKLKALKGRCHIIGCFSDGGVHAHINQIKALAKILEAQGNEVLVHAFLDGRDVAQRSALEYLDNCGLNIATVSGRYWAMDRDHKWDRVELAYNALIGECQTAETAEKAVEASYAEDVNDEFIKPFVIGNFAGMQDGDNLICANFRADRARHIMEALGRPDFTGFERKREVKFAEILGMVEYSEAHNDYMQTLFPPYIPPNTMPEVVSKAGIKQLRIAETEKYAHVTFFMSGGLENEFAGETRDLIPSPDVATYDLLPEMASAQVADNMAAAITSGEYGLLIANYANTDMVGHTGDLQAAIKAVEAVDKALGKLMKATDEAGGVLLLTADHGNAEIMTDEKGNPHTQHSLNHVPFVVASEKLGKLETKDGDLTDLAPTVLHLLGLDIPSEMTGKVLVS